MYFSLKYQLQTDSVWLFAECLPHKWMLFAAPRLHVHINITLIYACFIQHLCTDVDTALLDTSATHLESIHPMNHVKPFRSLSVTYSEAHTYSICEVTLHMWLIPTQYQDRGNMPVTFMGVYPTTSKISWQSDV